MVQNSDICAMFKSTHNPFDEIVSRLRAIETGLAQLVMSVDRDKTEGSIHDVLTVEAASQVLGLSRSTLYKKVRSGQIKSIKKGKRLYFTREALMSYIHSGQSLNIDPHKLLR